MTTTEGIILVDARDERCSSVVKATPEDCI